MAAFGFCSSQAPRRSEASSPYPPALIRVQVPPGGTRALDVRTVPGSGFHDCLPRFARGACSAARTKVSWISRKTSLSDFHEQVVLAPKMLVKATVRQ